MSVFSLVADDVRERVLGNLARKKRLVAAQLRKLDLKSCVITSTPMRRAIISSGMTETAGALAGKYEFRNLGPFHVLDDLDCAVV